MTWTYACCRCRRSYAIRLPPWEKPKRIWQQLRHPPSLPYASVSVHDLRSRSDWQVEPNKNKLPNKEFYSEFSIHVRMSNSIDITALKTSNVNSKLRPWKPNFRQQDKKRRVKSMHTKVVSKRNIFSITYANKGKNGSSNK